MKKQVRCFIIDTQHVTPDTNTVSELFELSEFSRTFAKRKEERKLKDDARNIIVSFHHNDDNHLTDDEVQLIISVTNRFATHATNTPTDRKSEIINNFINDHNLSASAPMLSFNYNELVELDNARYPDFFTFETDELAASVWLSDATFKLTYPLYDIVTILPFENFQNIVRDNRQMVDALGKVTMSDLIERINLATNGYPPSYNKATNIPYYEVKGAEPIDCYFGTNIWGEHGNYDYIIKEDILGKLKDLGLEDEFIEEHFPDIYKVNEFFFIPQWERYAIPYKTGQGSINSQITSTYNEPFTIGRFVPVYADDTNYLRDNTLTVPYPYNNINLLVVNGKYTREEIRKFDGLFGDLIAVPTGHPDFARMSGPTQRFMINMTYLMHVADSADQTEVFNKIMATSELRITFSNRNDIEYLSASVDEHRYYILPRYIYEGIAKEINND